MKPGQLVSVVVPVYNVEPYLRECLDSLASQTYGNLEVIIVDDGSTDGCKEICVKYAKKYSFMRTRRQKNSGLSAARNTGVEEARGDYICFVDSDDVVANDYVSKLLQAALKNNADVAVCGYDNFLPVAHTISGNDATIQLLTKQENLDVLAWNKIYRRSLFTDANIRYPVSKKHEDNLTTYKLYAAANRVTYVNASLYHYRVRSDSITGKGNILQRLQARELAAKEAIDFFADEPRLLQAAQASLLTAKLAFADAAITRGVSNSFFRTARLWVLSHHKMFVSNEFFSKKLKLYFALLLPLGGLPYIVFRKLKH